jgi:hypothetical protein
MNGGSGLERKRPRLHFAENSHRFASKVAQVSARASKGEVLGVAAFWWKEMRWESRIGELR